MDELLKCTDVQEALQFLREDDERTLREHLEMCQIPAPSYEEGEKAEYVRKKMVDAGLSDVHIDEVGNVLGTWKGTGNGPRIMIAGHTDTVFPRETDLTLKKEGERYSCPGIGDDTRAVAELLSLARALNATGIRGEGDIIFCANVCEEGLGDLRGIKHAFKDMSKTTVSQKTEAMENVQISGKTEAIKSRTFANELENHYDGFISIDDKNTSGIIYQAVGSERYLVTFHGTGGHSFTGFGIPNPIHAMGRAIAKISDFQTPKNPKTTFSVGVINGGTSVNVIAAECSMLVDMRSVDAGELEKLSAKFHQAIENAVQEENARWEDKDNRITVTFEQKGKRPAGTQDKSCQIVQAAIAANQALGMETLYIGAASTDANIPISLGIPAITVGWGGKGGGEHTIHEWYEHTESWKGPQRDLLLLLALSGYEEYKKHQLPHIKVK
ncbi:M20/M25/M40 family metallo-hydrolase [Blautia sp. Sow4_E7]|uniref:M20/M25/M40 family metallo-hydrolase n=1 Tax=Blautia sp. Sow4_E7 TaxID=3438749 RepID=UPI003F92BACB